MVNDYDIYYVIIMNSRIMMRKSRSGGQKVLHAKAIDWRPLQYSSVVWSVAWEFHLGSLGEKGAVPAGAFLTGSSDELSPSSSSPSIVLDTDCSVPALTSSPI